MSTLPIPMPCSWSIRTLTLRGHLAVISGPWVNPRHGRGPRDQGCRACYPQDRILTFVQSCHKMAWHMYRCVTNSFNGLIFELIFHKLLWRSCKFFKWHQTIYVWKRCVQYKVFVWSVPYCIRQAYIGSPLNNFVQHTPQLPLSPESLTDFWASSLSLSSFIFCPSIYDFLDEL